MKTLIWRGFLIGIAFSLCACATPASVDLTKDKADRLQQEQAEQKQKLEKLQDEQQQKEKQKMQEQIDKLKQQ